MHVLLLSVIDDPFDPPGYERFGGGHLYVLDLGRYLVRQGCRITYLVRQNHSEKPLDEEIGTRCRVVRVQHGVFRDVDPANLTPSIDSLTRSCMGALTAVDAVDVVHSHYWISGHVARQYVSVHAAWHVHTILSLGRVKTRGREETLPEDDRVRDRIEVATFNAADRLIASCPNEANDLAGLYPEVRRDHLAIIPYGVDPNVFFPRPQSAYHFVRRTTYRFQEGLSGIC